MTPDLLSFDALLYFYDKNYVVILILMFVQQPVPSDIKENIKIRHYCPFVRGIHQ